MYKRKLDDLADDMAVATHRRLLRGALAAILVFAPPAVAAQAPTRSVVNTCSRSKEPPTRTASSKPDR
jgi:hypothetical protein